MLEAFITRLLTWMESQNPVLVWLFFALSNVLENVFPPWPGDTVTVFGGFMLAHGTLDFWHLASSTFAGNMTGGIIMYYSGKKILHWMETHDFPFKDSFYSHEGIHKTFTWFHKNSVMVVVLSRFSAGIRFFVSIIAGMAHYPVFTYLAYFAVSICLWSSLLIGGGYSLGKNWEYILEMISLYNKTVLGLLFVAGLVYLYKKKSLRKSDNS